MPAYHSFIAHHHRRLPPTTTTKPTTVNDNTILSVEAEREKSSLNHSPDIYTCINNSTFMHREPILNPIYRFRAPVNSTGHIKKAHCTKT